MKTCGHDYQSRMRSVSAGAKYGGKMCPNLREGKSCTHVPCPTDCVTALWSQWSGCSVTCGSGVHGRTRSVRRQPYAGGRSCPALVETSLCNVMPCPFNCAVSKWSAWSTCSQMCGGGVQIRQRKETVAAAYGGLPCPILEQYATCNVYPCPERCVKSWSLWSACSRSCGTGLRSRHAEERQYVYLLTYFYTCV